MGIGRLAYQLYFRPIEVVRKTFKTGLRRTAAIRAGQREMQAAANCLREIIYPNRPAFQVYFLTGKKYWYQTAFCLYSLQRFAEVNIRAVLVDDGSFDDDLAMQVSQQFPSTSQVVRKSELDGLLEEKLPLAKFPVLRKRRLEYPHIRKLTDIHILPGEGAKLVLDSDMLFFRKPDTLLQWLSNPAGMLFMKDVEESYGYSASLLRQLSGVKTFPERLNVGIAGIPSSKINWDKLEYWTDELMKRDGSSYLQEQAITAMLAANENYYCLDEQDYKVLPSIEHETVPEILHHYVADAKYDYFVKGWKLLS
jgi:hypothetical protein